MRSFLNQLGLKMVVINVAIFLLFYLARNQKQELILIIGILLTNLISTLIGIRYVWKRVVKEYRLYNFPWRLLFMNVGLSFVFILPLLLATTPLQITVALILSFIGVPLIALVLNVLMADRWVELMDWWSQLAVEHPKIISASRITAEKKKRERQPEFASYKWEGYPKEETSKAWEDDLYQRRQ